MTRAFSRPCISGFITSMLSLMPLSSTVWLPSGMPASARRAQASMVSGVSSSGWVKWIDIQSGWKRFSMRVSRVRDALRHDHRDLGADAHEFEMLDRSQPVEQPFELVVADRQRIAAREQAVADFGVRLDILRGPLPLADRERVFAVGLADHAASACNSGNRSSRSRWSGTARGRGSGGRGRARRCRGPRRSGSGSSPMPLDEFAADRDVGPAQRLHRDRSATAATGNRA